MVQHISLLLEGTEREGRSGPPTSYDESARVLATHLLGSVVSHLNKDSDRPVANLRFFSTIISCNAMAFHQKCYVSS